MQVTIYHNPRCSKSRRTLSLLRERGIEPHVIEYIEAPPAATTLSKILDLLGMERRALLRRKEAPYADLGLDDTSLSRDPLIRAMVEHPILIERPIVLAGGKARLGRPPGRVLEIL
jgi:arsenate reductase